MRGRRWDVSCLPLKYASILRVDSVLDAIGLLLDLTLEYTYF